MAKMKLEDALNLDVATASPEDLESASHALTEARREFNQKNREIASARDLQTTVDKLGSLSDRERDLLREALKQDIGVESLGDTSEVGKVGASE